MFTKRNYYVGIIIFAAVWVLILALPKTRNILRSQIHDSKYEDIYWSNLQNGVREDQLDKYLKSHPNNYTLKIISLERENVYFTPSGPDEFDQIVKKHPKDAWIIKRRLLAYTLNKKLPLNKDLQRRLEFSYPVSGASKYTPNEIMAGLKLARIGEKLEPDNSFFDWMQANFLFAQQKPEAALKILTSATKKKSFDDGRIQLEKAYLEAIRLAGYNLFEERFLLSPGYLNVGYTDWIQATNGAAIWQGALAEQQGNHQKALEIYKTQLRLCSILQSSWTNITSTNHQLNSLAKVDWLSQKRFKQWIKGFPHLKYQYQPDNLTKLRELRKEIATYQITIPAQLFSQYALAHNDRQAAHIATDIANKISGDYNSITQIAVSESTVNPYDLLYGRFEIQTIFQLKWAGMQLWLSIFETLIFTWFVATLFVLLMTKRKHQFIAILNHQINKTTIVSTTLFVLCLYGVFLSFLFHQGISSNNVYQIISSPNDALRSFTQRYFFLTLIISSFLYCGIAALWKCRKSTFVNEAQNSFTSSMTAEQLKTRTHRISIFWQIMFWIFLPIIEAAWYWWIISGSYSLAIIPIPLIIGLVVWWIIKNVTLRQPAFFTGTYWLLFATWLQRSLAVLIIICTVAYGVTSWTSLPLRHDANIQLNHVLKVGQITALREALARDKAQHSDENTVE